MKTTTNELNILAGTQLVHQRTYLSVWGHVDIQASLQAGRERFGHALCLCRKEPLKLQVRLREGRYHLAVWPGESEKHDSECIFFQDDLSHQRPIALPGTDEREPSKDEPTAPRLIKRWDLRMAYQADGPQHRSQQTRAHALNDIKQAAEAADSASIVSVKKLTMLLWERADLCRWHPSWSRDWGRVRWQLQKTASDMSINQTPLEQLLFVPRPYRESAKQLLNNEWEEFVRSLPVNGLRRSSPRLLICAVRRYAGASSGRPAIVHLRHLRHPIALTESCDTYLNRDCRSAIKQLAVNSEIEQKARDNTPVEPENHFPEVVGCFLVDGTTRGGVIARAAWLMNVHPVSFIPANNPNAVMLVDSLIANGHSFSRLLSDLSPMARKSPEWIVRHVIDPRGQYVARAALEILDRGCSAEFRAVREQLAQAMALKGMPTWTWTPTGSWSQRIVPALPPTEKLSPDLAMTQLLTILNSADVAYGYSSISSPTVIS